METQVSVPKRYTFSSLPDLYKCALSDAIQTGYILPEKVIAQIHDGIIKELKSKRMVLVEKQIISEEDTSEKLDYQVESILQAAKELNCKRISALNAANENGLYCGIASVDTFDVVEEKDKDNHGVLNEITKWLCELGTTDNREFSSLVWGYWDIIGKQFDKVKDSLTIDNLLPSIFTGSKTSKKIDAVENIVLGADMLIHPIQMYLYAHVPDKVEKTDEIQLSSQNVLALFDGVIDPNLNHPDDIEFTFPCCRQGYVDVTLNTDIEFNVTEEFKVKTWASILSFGINSYFNTSRSRKFSHTMKLKVRIPDSQVVLRTPLKIEVSKAKADKFMEVYEHFKNIVPALNQKQNKEVTPALLTDNFPVTIDRDPLLQFIETLRKGDVDATMVMAKKNHDVLINLLANKKYVTGIAFEELQIAKIMTEAIRKQNSLELTAGDGQGMFRYNDRYMAVPKYTDAVFKNTNTDMYFAMQFKYASNVRKLVQMMGKGQKTWKGFIQTSNLLENLKLENVQVIVPADVVEDEKTLGNLGDVIRENFKQSACIGFKHPIAYTVALLPDVNILGMIDRYPWLPFIEILRKGGVDAAMAMVKKKPDVLKHLPADENNVLGIAFEELQIAKIMAEAIRKNISLELTAGDGQGRFRYHDQTMATPEYTDAVFKNTKTDVYFAVQFKYSDNVMNLVEMMKKWEKTWKGSSQTNDPRIPESLKLENVQVIGPADVVKDESTLVNLGDEIRENFKHNDRMGFKHPIDDTVTIKTFLDDNQSLFKIILVSEDYTRYKKLTTEIEKKKRVLKRNTTRMEKSKKEVAKRGEEIIDIISGEIKRQEGEIKKDIKKTIDQEFKKNVAEGRKKQIDGLNRRSESHKGEIEMCSTKTPDKKLKKGVTEREENPNDILSAGGKRQEGKIENCSTKPIKQELQKNVAEGGKKQTDGLNRRIESQKGEIEMCSTKMPDQKLAAGTENSKIDGLKKGIESLEDVIKECSSKIRKDETEISLKTTEIESVEKQIRSYIEKHMKSRYSTSYWKNAAWKEANMNTAVQAAIDGITTLICTFGDEWQNYQDNKVSLLDLTKIVTTKTAIATGKGALVGAGFSSLTLAANYATAYQMEYAAVLTNVSKLACPVFVVGVLLKQSYDILHHWNKGDITTAEMQKAFGRTLSSTGLSIAGMVATGALIGGPLGLVVGAGLAIAVGVGDYFLGDKLWSCLFKENPEKAVAELEKKVNQLKYRVVQAAYDLFDLTEHATQEELKGKYRAAVRKYHPDKGGNAEIFHAVHSAYEVICCERGLKSADYVDL